MVVKAGKWIITLDDLNKAINDYVSENDRKPYLFMCWDTAEMFWEDITTENFPEWYNFVKVNPHHFKELSFDNKTEENFYHNCSGTMGEYRNCKVYLNMDLEYGEVEIR